MPTTRRSTGGSRAKPGPGKGQSTISFSSQVTKSIPKDIKGALLSDTSAKKVEVPAPITPSKEEEPEEVKAEDTEEEGEDEEDVTVEEVVPEKPETELRAEKITDAQIGKYWKKIEAERSAPRVHQEDLILAEKVLRYFDVSSQYGPCIGISRMKRWQRADRLGLSPPIEVLAVLLKEEARNNTKIEKAHMDEIMNSTAIGAVA